MKTLIDTITIGIDGIAGDTPKVKFIEKTFNTAKNIFFQTFLSSVTFNRQDKSFWQATLCLDSWIAIENGKEVTHQLNEDTCWNQYEIKQCTKVKFVIRSRNGACSGIINVYESSNIQSLPTK